MPPVVIDDMAARGAAAAERQAALGE